MTTGPAVGVDVGGTKVAAGLVDAAGVVLSRAERPTPATAQALDDAVVELVDAVRGEGAVSAVGVATAGLVDPVTGGVTFAVNVPWTGHAVREELARRFGTPVTVDNDANAAAWAEHRFGAGAGARCLVVVTLGTGIGGGLVLDGHLLRGAHGAAAEFGHMPIVSEGGRPCGCGRTGCWEQYLSGTALTYAAGGTSGRAIAAAAAEADPRALALLTEQGCWLGRGLAVIAGALDPDVVVVGGGLSALGDLVLGPARTTLADLLAGALAPPPDVRAAALGNDAGLVGAADLARSARTADPGARTP